VLSVCVSCFSEIKQKNEGGWNFKWDEESKPGYVLLEVEISRFMDSSLIDVDVHPSYISLVIKSKVSVVVVIYRTLFCLRFILR
jgi:protein TilB